MIEQLIPKLTGRAVTANSIAQKDMKSRNKCRVTLSSLQQNRFSIQRN